MENKPPCGALKNGSLRALTELLCSSEYSGGFDEQL
jgi:hypothetical protein